MKKKLTIRREGDAYFASMANPAGDAEIGEIQVDGNHIEFSFSPAMGLTFSYRCDVDGDRLSGEAITPRGTLPFAGVRQ